MSKGNKLLELTDRRVIKNDSEKHVRLGKR